VSDAARGNHSGEQGGKQANGKELHGAPPHVNAARNSGINTTLQVAFERVTATEVA
jgi:hypothetical protein